MAQFLDHISFQSGMEYNQIILVLSGHKKSVHFSNHYSTSIIHSNWPILFRHLRCASPHWWYRDSKQKIQKKNYRLLLLRFSPWPAFMLTVGFAVTIPNFISHTQPSFFGCLQVQNVMPARPPSHFFPPASPTPSHLDLQATMFILWFVALSFTRAPFNFFMPHSSTLAILTSTVFAIDVQAPVEPTADALTTVHWTPDPAVPVFSMELVHPDFVRSFFSLAWRLAHKFAPE